MSSPATIQKVKSLEPIENADKIELLKFESVAWQVVVQKDLHVVGDMVVFIEVDSIVPEKPEFEFLKKCGYRVKSCKLRGCLSQGVVLPLRDVSADMNTIDTREEGLDVSELLGVKHYEKPLPAELSGVAKGNFPTHIVPKTDQKRLQNTPRIIGQWADEEFFVTEKLDGSSFTCLWHPDFTDFGVCSRNLMLERDEENTFWRMVKKYHLDSGLQSLAEWTYRHFALQGEVVGPGINGNKLGLNEHRLYVFHIYDIVNQTFLPFTRFKNVCLELGVNTVPILEEGKSLKEFGQDMESFLSYAEGKSVLAPDRMREGVVFCSMEEKSDPRIGRLSFKVINNKYALKNKE